MLNEKQRKKMTAASEDEFFSNPIELSSLDATKPNYRQVGEGVEVVVLVRGGGLRVFRDLCTHMGASMSQGKYCAGEETLQCPWHGYAFDADTGEFIKNPNDAVFGCMKGLYKSYRPEKTPKYRLSALSYKIAAGKAYVCRRRAT